MYLYISVSAIKISAFIQNTFYKDFNVKSIVFYDRLLSESKVFTTLSNQKQEYKLSVICKCRFLIQFCCLKKLHYILKKSLRTEFICFKDELSLRLQHGSIRSEENVVLYNITLQMALVLYVLFCTGMLNRTLCVADGMP